jgi:hypothetical protein
LGDPPQLLSVLLVLLARLGGGRAGPGALRVHASGVDRPVRADPKRQLPDRLDGIGVIEVDHLGSQRLGTLQPVGVMIDPDHPRRAALERRQDGALPHRPASNVVLWKYSNEIFQGQTIERLDLAALGPNAPVPPGISRLPRRGEYYASPALSALLRSTPRDELGDRYPGSQVGTIGERALSAPNELVIFVGYSPAQLARFPSAFRVSTIATAPGKQVWSPYFRDAFVVGALAFLFPILILIGTATRLAAARRLASLMCMSLISAPSMPVGRVGGGNRRRTSRTVGEAWRSCHRASRATAVGS